MAKSGPTLIILILILILILEIVRLRQMARKISAVAQAAQHFDDFAAHPKNHKDAGEAHTSGMTSAAGPEFCGPEFTPGGLPNY